MTLTQRSNRRIPAMESMRRNHLVARYLWFALGVMITSFAIALIAKSDLGVGAISCVAYVLAEASGLSFGALIDVSALVLSPISLTTLPAQAVALAVGCFLLALGIAIEVAPNVILVPGEGIVRAINAVTQKPFGSCKAAFDTTLVVVALALSFLLLGRVAGVGVGTVVSAVTVGRIVNVLNRHMPVLAHISSLTRDAMGAPEEAL